MAESGEKEEKSSSEQSEDINVDFGKIKGFFNKKNNKAAAKTESTNEAHNREHKPHGHHDDSLKKDDEFELDFSKIKGVFSRLKGKNTDNESVDLSSATDFLGKHYLTIFMILGIIVSVGLGMSIRMESGDLKFTENWARSSIDTTLRNDVSAFVQQTYPNLPGRNRETLVNEEMGKAYAANRYTFKGGQFAGQAIDIEQQVQATASQFKQFFQDDKGRNYMPDIDPYYWLRYAENIIETGHVGDKQVSGQEWDDHQFAPVGRPIAPQDTFYPTAIVIFHNFIGKPFGTIIGADTELIRTFMFLPVFIMALTSLFVYLITRRIAGNMAAFFAAAMVGVHGALMSRTMFGHADSDALIVFFSVFILWFMVEAFVATRLKWKLAWAAGAGLATGLYSLAWGGWWWIFDFIMAASVGTIGLIVLYIGAKHIRSVSGIFKATTREKTVRKAIATIAVYFGVTGIFVSLFSGLSTFILTPIASLGFRTIKTPVVDTSLPNVLRTVAELNEGTVQQAINQLGQQLFYIAVIGIFLIIARAAFEALKQEKNTGKILQDIFFALVLSLWFVATLYAVTKGIRFTLLLVPAFSIAFGAVFGMVATYTSGWLHKEFKFNRLATMAVLFFVLMLVFPGPTFDNNVMQASRNIVRNDVPLINDAWHASLTKIKENSQEDAIITSWWDFGHHFKQIADRPVTFDGTTQGSPQAHWVGRFFSTDNEKEAVGILRMLDCGAQTGTDHLKEIKGDYVEAILLTKRIILLEKDEARSVLLEEGLAEEEADEVLELTHCNPPEGFLIASEDMIGKSGVWGHFGGWNFTKADIWKATRGMTRTQSVDYMTGKFEMSDDEANSLFDQMQIITDDREADAWISPWPGFSGDLQGCGYTNEEVVVCGDGLIVNMTSKDAFYQTNFGMQHPASFVYLTNNSVVERKYSNNTIQQDLSVMLVPQGSGFFRVLASPHLIDGIFARMFFLQGHGLECFSLLTRERGFTGTDIYVWEVDWDCGQKNTIPELLPPVIKTEVSNGDEVTLDYIGYLPDGTVFDTSLKAQGLTNESQLEGESEPFTFTLGTGQVIPGFEQGLIGAEAGERRIEVSPELGYNVPGHPLYNQTLYFRVNVLSIK